MTEKPFTFPEPPQLEMPIKMEKSQTAEPAVVSEAEIDSKVEETMGPYKRTLSGGLQSPRAEVPQKAILERIKSKREASSYQLGKQLSLKWSTGAGPRIGCVADYPLELRMQALEFVSLSPRSGQPIILSPRSGLLPTPHSSRRLPSCLSPASVCAGGES